MASEGRFSQGYHALFVQDDWRVGPKLTVNAGLRMEINSGMKEAQDRNLAGFDFTTPNPIEAAARAAYAANPIPEIPVSAFRVTGGLLFADGPANETVTKFLPRAAASYLLGERTVLRGGIGLFSYDYFFENINQAGFAQATPVIVSTDTGLTFTGANLTNPVPSGQLIQPVGSALGLQSQLGQNLGTLYQREREAAYYTRWEGSIAIRAWFLVLGSWFSVLGLSFRSGSRSFWAPGTKNENDNEEQRTKNDERRTKNREPRTSLGL